MIFGLCRAALRLSARKHYDRLGLLRAGLNRLCVAQELNWPKILMGLRTTSSLRNRGEVSGEKAF